jgi:hypothetical protein
MRTLRALRRMHTSHASVPRKLRRADFDMSDATMEPDPGPPPEAVFDRSTGPFGRRRGFAMPGAPDEET